MWNIPLQLVHMPQRYDAFQQIAMLRLKIPEAELEPRSQTLLNLSGTTQKDDQGRVYALMEQINAEAQSAQTNGITAVEWTYLGRPQQLKHLILPDDGSLRTGAGSQKLSPVRQTYSDSSKGKQQVKSPMRSAGGQLKNGTVIGSPMQYFQRYSYDASRTHQKISQNQIRLKQIAEQQQQHEDETRQRQIEDLESRKKRDDERAEQQAKRHEALKTRQQQVFQNYTKNMEAAADELRRQNMDLVNQAASRERLCKSQRADRAKAVGAAYNEHLAQTLDRKKKIIEAEHTKKINAITRNGLRGTHFVGEFDWDRKTQKQNQSDWEASNAYNRYSSRTNNFERTEKLEKLEQKLKDAQQKAEDRYNKKMADRVNYLTTYRGNYDKIREERARDREEAFQQKVQARNAHNNQVKQRNQAVEEAMIQRMLNYDSTNRAHTQRVKDVQQRRFDHISGVSQKQLLNYEMARQRRKELVQLGEMQAREIQAKLDTQNDRIEAFQMAKRLRNEQNVQLETFLEAITDPAARRELVEAHAKGIDVVGNALISNGVVYTPEQQAVLEKIKNERSMFQSKTQAAVDNVKKMTM